jgi:signal transduction histidine kinase
MSPSPALMPATSELVEHVRRLVDRSPLPTIATQGQAHMVRYVNPAFCWLVGQTAETIVDSPVKEALSPCSGNEHDATLALLDLVYGTGTAEFGLDLAHVFGNASAIHLPCAVWPMLGDDNRPLGLLIQVSARAGQVPVPPNGTPDELLDVNQRLVLAGLKAQEQADVELTLRGQAEAALNVRDEFMSIAAHELRTPVTAIKAGAQLAQRRLDDSTPDGVRTLQYLDGIVRAANRLVLLINDLMDVSRMRDGQLLLRRAPMDLVSLVSAVTQRYSETSGEDHDWTLDMPAASLVVTVDAGRLEQVLDNLLSNAVKYSPGGGDIEVSLRRVVDGITLRVRDSGIGLTPGAHERIFEPFGRAPNATRHGMPGMGLGLHICRRIAEAHGGRMWAESDGEGQGMTVSLWLPA